MTVGSDDGILAHLSSRVSPPSGPSESEARRRLDSLVKPAGSLGHLEDVAVHLVRAYGHPPPALDAPAVIIFAADHGVAVRGVSAYPSSVTAAMCRNFAAGGAAACVLARAVGASLRVVDVGVDADLRGVMGIEGRKVRRGSRDLSTGPALTADELQASVRAGADAVDRATQAGADLLVVGEMGIGNTTAASALGAALLGRSADDMVGRGTGVGPDRLTRKREVVARALARVEGIHDPETLLAELGGLEIAALTGALLAAAGRGRVVLLDGFIVGVAALAAHRICPAVYPWLVAAHRSDEVGHGHVLQALSLRPLLELDLRLGEASGALLAFPLLRAASAVVREMATFEEAGVSGPEAP